MGENVFSRFYTLLILKIRGKVSKNRLNNKKCLERGENRRNNKKCLEVGENFSSIYTSRIHSRPSQPKAGQGLVVSKSLKKKKKLKRNLKRSGPLEHI